MSAYTYLLSRHKAEQTQIDHEALNVSTQKVSEKVYEFSMFTDLPFTKMNEASRPIGEFSLRSALCLSIPLAADDKHAITTINNVHYPIIYIFLMENYGAFSKLIREVSDFIKICKKNYE
jgi:hypothetical protein